MLETIFVWLYIAFIGYSFGTLSFQLYSYIFKPKERLHDLDITILLGILVVTTLGAYWSLFEKIGFVFNAVLYTGSFAILFRYKNVVIEQWKALTNFQNTDYNRLIIYGFGIIILGTTLLYSVSTPIVYDTGLYHAQAIKWINDFAAIPGLGNVHGRFAFNSHYFIPSAIFSFTFIDGVTVYALNSFLFVLIISRCILKISKSYASKNSIGLTFYSALVLSLLFFLSPFISSPGPDIATAILLLYMVIMYQHIEERDSQYLILLLLIFGFSAVTIKLSALFIVLLPIVLIFLNPSSRKINIISLFVVGAFFLLPFLLRNIILSGYLVYPLVQLDIFSFDWKIEAEAALEELAWIKSWAKVPFESPENVLAMSIGEWFPRWWSEKLLITKILLGVNLLPPLLIFTNKSITLQAKKQWPVIGVLLLNITFWFFNAPDVRFAFGLLMGNGALALAIILNKLPVSRHILLAILVLACSVQLYMIPEHFWGKDFISKAYLTPLPIPSSELKKNQVDNFEVYSPMEGDQCYNAPLPCTPYPNPKLSLRGNTFSDGFRMDHFKYHNIEARSLLKLTSFKSDSIAGMKVYFYSPENKLLFETSDSSLLNKRFFLHVHPVEINDLEDNSSQNDFANLDFNWGKIEKPFEGNYYRVVDLPKFPILVISVGQFDNDQRFWKLYMKISE